MKEMTDGFFYFKFKDNKFILQSLYLCNLQVGNIWGVENFTKTQFLSIDYIYKLKKPINEYYELLNIRRCIKILDGSVF